MILSSSTNVYIFLNREFILISNTFKNYSLSNAVVNLSCLFFIFYQAIAWIMFDNPSSTYIIYLSLSILAILVTQPTAIYFPNQTDYKKYAVCSAWQGCCGVTGAVYWKTLSGKERFCLDAAGNLSKGRRRRIRESGGGVFISYVSPWL